jgi:peptidoglycan/LPS O-acetylase OafA/YrhL
MTQAPPVQAGPTPAAVPDPANRPAAPRSSGYLPTLDGWRAVAVAMVIASHFASDDHQWTDWGANGVVIFFGLSGLLICSRLLEEDRLRGRISLGAFYVRRAFRILPAAWFYLAALLVLSAVAGLVLQRGEVLSCFLFWRNYFPTGPWYTQHYWSLAVEEHFYLFFPALLVLLRPRWAFWVLPVLAVGCAGWRSFDNRVKLLTDLLPGRTPYFRTDFRLDFLLFGCWAAYFLHGARSRWLRGWVGEVVGWAAIAGVTASFLGYLRFTAAQAFLIPWMLVGTTLNPRGVLGRVLELPPLRYLGRLSYSLYLWQQLFFVKYPGNRTPDLAAVQTWPWNLLVLLAVAAASYHLVEKPLVRLGHRLARPATEGRPA